MNFTKPEFPIHKLRDEGFPKKTKWNPHLPISSVSNIPPQSMWPIKLGKPVFFLDSRFDNPCSGRVSFYNPARKQDYSCVTTEGHPLLCIQGPVPWSTAIISVDNVFPYTKKGWLKCLRKIASDKLKKAIDNKKRSIQLLDERNRLVKEANDIYDEIERIR